MLPSVIRTPKTAEDIALGVTLARMHGRTISLSDVARVLRTAGVTYVVVGDHAANGYTGKPRTTVDVDVIVQFPQKAAKAVAAAFPHLTMHDTAVVIRFMDEEREAIDLMKPSSSPLWAALLKQNREVEVDGIPVTIPLLEGMLAAKFAAMSSLNRGHGDKLIDAGDFTHIVEANATIDLDLLAELGELVFSGGGPFIRRLVGDVRAGRRLEF
jgi:predicted nucleotidyltransferase